MGILAALEGADRAGAVGLAGDEGRVGQREGGEGEDSDERELHCGCGG